MLLLMLILECRHNPHLRQVRGCHQVSTHRGTENCKPLGSGKNWLLVSLDSLLADKICQPVNRAERALGGLHWATYKALCEYPELDAMTCWSDFDFSADILECLQATLVLMIGLVNCPVDTGRCTDFRPELSASRSRDEAFGSRLGAYVHQKLAVCHDRPCT